MKLTGKPISWKSGLRVTGNFLLMISMLLTGLFAGSHNASAALAGTALQFDGANDYVTFGAAAGLGVQQFTIETWFKRTGAGDTTSTGTDGITAVPLVTKGRNQNNNGTNTDINYFLGINGTDRLVADFEECAVGMGAPCTAGGTAGLNHPVTGSTVIQNNVWYHAAVTYDGRYWNLYLNGVLETMTGADVGATRYPRWDSAAHAGIATAMRTNGSEAGFFQGIMDEVRIWNVVRTPAQIQAGLYEELTSGTGLVARWGLNEGAGTTTASSVGTFPGTLTNGPVWVTGFPDGTPPVAPANLMASASEGGNLLEWTANTESDLVGYRVYRSTTSPVVLGMPFDDALSLSPSFLDTSLELGITYYYAVTAVDSSGNESLLSNQAGATALTQLYREALDLGSAQAYVSLGDQADTATFTLETWLRRDGAGTAILTGTGGETLVPLITNGSYELDSQATNMNYYFGIRGSDGVLCADFEEGNAGSTPGQNHPVCGVTPVTDGTWIHAAVTYDGATLRIYLNGVQDVSQAINEPANAANTARLAFGSSLTTTNVPSGYFDGALDEIRIWNYPRTQFEINSAMHTKLAAPQTGMIGRWSLDEGAGSTANDTSGSGFTGTVTGTGYSWITAPPVSDPANLLPAAPGSPLPSAGNSWVGTTTPDLSVVVSDPEGHSLDVTFYGRARQPAGPDFTIAVLPSPRYYNSTHPAIYQAQMTWIRDHQASENIVYVASLGDQVDLAGSLTQWNNAVTAFDIIDAAGIPYGLATGNHDGAPSGTANFNTYFGLSRFSGKPYYGGNYGSDNDSHYDLFSASGLDFIALFIEYDDTMTSAAHPVLQWANSVLQTHASRRALVFTHNLLQGSASTDFSAQGQAVYDALRANPNLFMINGANLDVATRRTDTFGGNTVYSLRADYQTLDSQQSGYLRLLRFSPSNGLIYVRAYSPSQDRYYSKADADQSNFILPYAMDATPVQLIGTVSGVTSGATAAVQWPNRAYSTEYEWFAVSSDGTHFNASPTWTFTTGTPTAATLTSFRAEPGSEAVLLRWETASEVSIAGFNLYRRGPWGDFEQVNDTIIPPQAAGQLEGALYSYLDWQALPGGRYEYKVEVLRTDTLPGENVIATYWPFKFSLSLLMR